MMLRRSISVWDYLTGPQTMLTVIIIPLLTRPGNCGTCSVGQVIRATLSNMHSWSGWSSAVCFQPSQWAHIALPALKYSHMTLMGFKPKTFGPAVWHTNHYALGTGQRGFLSERKGKVIPCRWTENSTEAADTHWLCPPSQLCSGHFLHPHTVTPDQKTCTLPTSVPHSPHLKKKKKEKRDSPWILTSMNCTGSSQDQNEWDKQHFWSQN